MTLEATAEAARTDGRIAAIRGGVVDVAFDGPVPKVHDLLHAGDVALEVAALIGDGLVRAMAMAPVRGLGLGMTVTATGAPIMVPVGDAVLGRMLDVFGAPIDGLPAPETSPGPRRPGSRTAGRPSGGGSCPP